MNKRVPVARLGKQGGEESEQKGRGRVSELGEECRGYGRQRESLLLADVGLTAGPSRPPSFACTRPLSTVHSQLRRQAGLQLSNHVTGLSGCSEKQTEPAKFLFTSCTSCTVPRCRRLSLKNRENPLVRLSFSLPQLRYFLLFSMIFHFAFESAFLAPPTAPAPAARCQAAH